MQYIGAPGASMEGSMSTRHVPSVLGPPCLPAAPCSLRSFADQSVLQRGSAAYGRASRCRREYLDTFTLTTSTGSVDATYALQRANVRRHLSQSPRIQASAGIINEPSSAMRYPATEKEPAADPQYIFACPICLTTELKVEKASSR